MLDRDRPYSYGGALPFQLRSIKDYCDLFEDELSPNEVRLLMALDNRLLTVKHRLQGEK